MYEMSQRHPVWVAENHVNPCNSVEFSVHLCGAEPSGASLGLEEDDIADLNLRISYLSAAAIFIIFFSLFNIFTSSFCRLQESG
jgi:hypothetical protein